MKMDLTNILLYFILITISVICIVPFLSVFVNATRSDSEIFQHFTLIPSSSLWQNLNIMQSKINYIRALYNSLLISLGGTLLSCYFGTLGGYALAKIQFSGRKLVFSLVLLTLIMPWQVGIIGFFDLANRYRMIDTYWPLILPAMGAPQMVFFTKQYIEKAFHNELIEAARVEGASELSIFHYHALPIAAPAIFTMGLIVFVSLWNNYINPLVILISQKKMPIPVVLNLISTPQEYHPGASSLGLALSVSLAIVIFLIFSKYIFSSNNIGALKE